MSREQSDLFNPPIQPRGVFASTSHAANPPDESKANQRGKIMALLAAYGPQTYHQVAERVGIELQTVCWRMKELKADGSVRFAVKPDGSISKQGNRKLVELVPMRRAG